jgi:hypothetical protein
MPLQRDSTPEQSKTAATATAGVTAPIEPEAPRARKKWADLHEALSQLKQARGLAAANAGPAGETGPVDKAAT